jgi:hypothetical protein
VGISYLSVGGRPGVNFIHSVRNQFKQRSGEPIMATRTTVPTNPNLIYRWYGYLLLTTLLAITRLIVFWVPPTLETGIAHTIYTWSIGIPVGLAIYYLGSLLLRSKESYRWFVGVMLVIAIFLDFLTPLTPNWAPLAGYFISLALIGIRLFTANKGASVR